jgi:hypothetical protein
MIGTGTFTASEAYQRAVLLRGAPAPGIKSRTITAEPAFDCIPIDPR